MEVSTISTTSRRYSSSAGSSLVETGSCQIRNQCSVSISLPRRSSQLSLGRIGFHTPKEDRFKVLMSVKKEIPVLEARSMDEIYDSLAERLVPTAAVESNPNLKYIIGLAGPPGAGKSTLSSEVACRVNKLWSQKASAMNSLVNSPDVAIVLRMDGFHLYRHQLDQMEDPEEAHARRGAPWTFNPELLLKCLKTMRDQGSVYAPSFDHGVGDPVEDDIFVNLQHKVVIVEGNYLLLEEGIWKDISSTFNEKWFIEVDIDTAMDRVLKRHISMSARSPDIAKWRIQYNDRPNAELINKSKKNADLIIRLIVLKETVELWANFVGCFKPYTTPSLAPTNIEEILIKTV